MAARIPGSQDYTPADEDVPVGQEPYTAGVAFDACGEACQTVHIAQGDVYEVRYRQNGDVSGSGKWNFLYDHVRLLLTQYSDPLLQDQHWRALRG